VRISGPLSKLPPWLKPLVTPLVRGRVLSRGFAITDFSGGRKIKELNLDDRRLTLCHEKVREQKHQGPPPGIST